MNILLKQISLLENQLHYTFQNKEFLVKAFTHRSYLNECGVAGLESNERLEFLGDSVLNLYVTYLLYTLYPGVNEGTLSKYRATLICQNSCATMLGKLSVIDFLVVGKGDQEMTKKRPSIASDLFEAIIGAIFLDGGYEGAYNFLKYHFLLDFQEILQQNPRNAKAELQELCLKLTKNLPEYRLLDSSGPSHEKTFRIGVYIENVLMGEAFGKSKRVAEQEAATIALLHYKTSLEATDS
jgi:ribonuclease III